jgi:hypothetical protein
MPESPLPETTLHPFTLNPSGGSASDTRPVAAPTSELTRVCSPLGIRLVSGLVAPYLHVAAQRELQSRWGHGAATLFDDTLDTVQALRTHPALHAALGVWVRNHHLPTAATTALGDLLAALPLDDAQAQTMLDRWASENTADMIRTFPGQVDVTTTAVLASAVAMDDTWRHDTFETRMGFAGRRVEAFEADLSPWSVISTADGSTVRALLRLSSGLKMHFAISTHGPEHAARLLETPEVFDTAIREGQPFVTSREVEQPTEMVAFISPEFTTRTTVDVGAEAGAWGLEKAVATGAPGLGDLPMAGILQEAFIEVTHSGVKAAAVTVMMFAAANMALPTKWHRQTVLTLDEPFAYEIVSPSLSTPLFTGIYAG